MNAPNNDDDNEAARTTDCCAATIHNTQHHFMKLGGPTTSKYHYPNIAVHAYAHAYYYTSTLRTRVCFSFVSHRTCIILRLACDRRNLLEVASCGVLGWDQATVAHGGVGGRHEMHVRASPHDKCVGASAHSHVYVCAKSGAEHCAL